MRALSRVWVFFLLTAFVCWHADGQAGATGTILGTVSDNANASVPNATVEVMNKATGVARTTTSGSAGDYSISNLNPGTYRITITAPGFGRQITDNVTLAVAQQARVNSSLKAGGVSETVQVNAGAVTLDTDTSSISQLVSQKQVDQLPLNGRNFLNLLFIGAGAVQTVGEQGQMRTF